MMLFESYGSVRRGIYGFLFGLAYGAFNIITRRISIAIWLDPDHQVILNEDDPLDQPPMTEEVKLSKEDQQEMNIMFPPGYEDYEEEGTEMMTTQEYMEQYRKCKKLAEELRRRHKEDSKEKEVEEDKEYVCVMDPSESGTAKCPEDNK